MNKNICSWIDLPQDDFTAILGYVSDESIKLHELNCAYHDLPKEDKDCLQLRVDRLEGCSCMRVNDCYFFQ